MKNSFECCLGKILKVIHILQKNARNGCFSFDEGCIRPFLGTLGNTVCFNTRPITLYNKNGTLFTAGYNDSSLSSVFRVEEVDDCCVKLQILEEDPSASDINRFVATKQFITVNLKCICALKCLDDVAILNL